jgi:hypothetical protein
MNKLLSLISASLFATAGYAIADLSVTFSDANGTPNAVNLSPSVSAQQFTFDVSLSYTNTGSLAVPNVAAIDYWLHASGNADSLFSIVSRTFTDSIAQSPTFGATSSWSDPTQDPQGDAVPANAANTHDIGGSTASATGIPAPQNAAFVATVTLQIAGNAPVGSYSISLGASPGNVVAQVSDDATVPNVYAIPLNAANTYTITVVPEPSTCGLLVLGALLVSSARTWRRHGSR